MKNNKALILSLVSVITLIAVVLGATYAYFTAQTKPGGGANINVQAGTTDTLSFSKGSDINLTATLATFGKTNGNVTGSIAATATLVPNNTTGNAEATYNVYLDIIANTLEYTTESKEVELLLKVTDPITNKEIINIDGLKYKTVTDIKGVNQSGFDITTEEGLIKIGEGYIISATNNITATQNWIVEVILVNLNEDQEKNTGKTFKAELVMGIDKRYAAFADNCLAGNENTFACDIIKTASTDETLLLHNASLTNGAEDNSYRYAGGNYKVSSKYSSQYSDVSSIVIFNCNETDTDGSTYCFDEHLNDLEYYTLVYDTNNISYTSRLEAIAQAMKDGYIDGIVNNFVCFGSDEDTCPEDNLYRIIGVFGDTVKVIKTSLEFMAWDTKKQDNEWSTASLNTYLNGEFLTALGDEWNNKIAITTWQLGGNTHDNIAIQTPKAVYRNEIINPSENIKYNEKIGLMYVSDYGFAASTENWTLPLYAYLETDYSSVIANNWMYFDSSAWTITRDTDDTKDTKSVFYIHLGGYVRSNWNYPSYGLFPVFHLTAETTLKSGSGTLADPYRVNI